MDNVPPDPNSTDNIGVAPSPGSTEETTPRWVYVFGITVVVLVLLFGILHITSGSLGGHTP
jgi:hypothetical protein